MVNQPNILLPANVAGSATKIDFSYICVVLLVLLIWLGQWFLILKEKFCVCAFERSIYFYIYEFLHYVRMCVV